jgi:hypothetical protein
MKALVYRGPGKRAWEEMPRPTIKEGTDAVVKIASTTLCGSSRADRAVSRIAHGERHASDRGWLRAAVLGADDGVVSTASLMIGVAAASASKDAVLVAGVAGLVAGALSMAAGEYVSVSSQRDAEEADMVRERRELSSDPRGELE